MQKLIRGMKKYHMLPNSKVCKFQNFWRDILHTYTREHSYNTQVLKTGLYTHWKIQCWMLKDANLNHWTWSARPKMPMYKKSLGWSFLPMHQYSLNIVLVVLDTFCWFWSDLMHRREASITCDFLFFIFIH